MLTKTQLDKLYLDREGKAVDIVDLQPLFAQW